MDTLNKDATYAEECQKAFFLKYDFLTTVDFGDCVSLDSIESDAFYETLVLKGLDFSNCTSLVSIGPGAFCACGADSIRLPDTKSVREIGNSTFRSAIRLEEIDLSNTSIKTIGNDMFSDAINLRRIKFPPTLEGEFAEDNFRGCVNLRELELPLYAPPTVILDKYVPNMPDGSKKESINKKECVLYVPRQSVSFYRNEMYWGDFTHIEPLPYDIYALQPIVNNAEAGTVSGGGMYYPGDSAYMTVTVNDGYRFVRWSDGGEGQQRWVKIISDSVIMAYFERDNAGTVEVQSESGLSISAASGNIVIKTPVSHVYIL